MAHLQITAAAQQRQISQAPARPHGSSCRRKAATARHVPRRQSRLATSAGEAAAGSSARPADAEAAKAALLHAVAGTERGGEARGLQRGMVEEAQVAVEAFGSAEELDFDRLEGRWRLEYTTARDVLPLVAPQRLPAPLQVGRIWQQFSSVEEGRVLNVIEALLPPQLPLAEGAGLTLVVEAGWEVHSARNIALSFREAGFQDVTLSPGLQNLLASPILPRGWWNQRLLLAIKQLALRVPLTSRLLDTTPGQQLPVGLNYMLTYLDDDMLIGRAQGGGGTFIFTRDREWEAAHAAQAATAAGPAAA